MAAALARELDDRLHRARVRALLLDGDARRLLLFMRESTLVLELHPEAGWVTLGPPAEPGEGARPLAGRIIEVAPHPDESAIRLGIQRIRGRDEGVELHVEWTGNRWNAIVAGHRSGVIRHVLVPRSERTRTLRSGSPYVPPPSTERAGRYGTLPPGAWASIVPPEADPDERRRALLSGIAWSSSLNAPLFLRPEGEAAWRAALDPDRQAGHLVRTKRGLQPYPIKLPDSEPTRFKTLLEAIAAAREASDEAPAPRALLLPPGLLERAGRHLRRLEGRVRGLRRQLEGAVDPAATRALGDLLLARYGELPQGASEVTLTGFDGEPVRIELDPALAPHENAGRYYDEAGRIERARKELPPRLAEAEAELERWRERVRELEEGRIDPALVLEELGPATTRERGRGSQAEALPYRSFRSSGGFEIRVGRGAARNDDLTFRHAAPDEIWLHARQAAGAHVILRWSGEGSPPRADLVEAAILAALHSEARHSGTVAVDWTRRKYVRKPRGAPPGAVVPDRVGTLFVEPDPSLTDRLR